MGKFRLFLMIALIFPQIAFTTYWGIERKADDKISIANPNQKILIPFPEKENVFVNQGKNFEWIINGEGFYCHTATDYKVCRNKNGQRLIQEIYKFGYVAKGDDNLKKDTFVAYPEHVQNKIRQGTPFNYHAIESHWGWNYHIDPIQMEQKNIEYSTRRPIHAISSEGVERETSFTIKLQSGKTYSAYEFDQLVQQRKNTENNILKNYCVYRSNEWCQQESKVVHWLKQAYGENVRIVDGRNPDLAPEFNFFKAPDLPKMELHLNNLQDVADMPYSYDEFINLDTYDQNQIENKIIAKIARTLGVNKDQILNLTITKGSAKVSWETPSTCKTLNYSALDSQMKKEFDAFEKMEIHSAFLLPEFDINMFDEAGHKDFNGLSGSFTVGGMTYHQPSGWIRMGLKVLGKYDNGDNEWLEPFGGPGCWVRGFHGPGSCGGNALETSSKIIKSGGLRIGNGPNVHGPGVYWSDDPNFASGSYDGDATSHGRKYKVKLQVAVNPRGYSNNGNGNFHVPNPANIRVYGILIKQI